MQWGQRGTSARGGAEAMLHLRAAACGTDPIDFRAAARRAALPS